MALTVRDPFKESHLALIHYIGHWLCHFSKVTLLVSLLIKNEDVSFKLPSKSSIPLIPISGFKGAMKLLDLTFKIRPFKSPSIHNVKNTFD